MAITLVGTATNTTYASRTNTTVTKPTGVVDGDYLLVGIVSTGPGGIGVAPAVTAAAGFTILSGLPVNSGDGVTSGGNFNVKLWIYGKVASSEGASWTFNHSSCSSQGWALAYRGVDTTTPLDATPTKNFGDAFAGSPGTTSTATGITTVTNGAMIVFAEHDFADNAAASSPPAGTTPTFTERLDVTLSYLADGVLATAGATGNKTSTNSNVAGSPWTAVLIAIRPAATAAGPAPSGRRPGIPAAILNR